MTDDEPKRFELIDMEAFEFQYTGEVSFEGNITINMENGGTLTINFEDRSSFKKGAKTIFKLAKELLDE